MIKVLNSMVIILFTTLCSFGQNNSIDYDFLNVALPQIRKPTKEHLLLINKSYKRNMSQEPFDYYNKELKGKIEPEALKEIIRNSRSSYLDSFKFSAKLISKDINAFLITPQIADSLQHLESAQLFYRCTVPVFDDKKMYAVIDFGGDPKFMAMVGCMYLFKRTKGGWEFIGTFDCWAS